MKKFILNIPFIWKHVFARFVTWKISKFYDFFLLDYFGLLFKPYVPTIFATSGKKGSRPKWTKCKHGSDNAKKCLSVGNFGILSVVCLSVCLSRVYSLQLMQRPEIFTKSKVYYPKLSQRGPIFYFRDSLFGQGRNIVLCFTKKFTKMNGI